jgi:hypothetical protein
MESNKLRGEHVWWVFMLQEYDLKLAILNLWSHDFMDNSIVSTNF